MKKNLLLRLLALTLILPFAQLHGGTTATGCDSVPFLFSGVSIQNPDWQIQLNEFGFSDFLLDKSVEFEGREYLSGEWVAAVGYNREGTVVDPMWLDPKFYFPDWCTNSTFAPVDPENPFNFISSDPILGSVVESTISNDDLEITMRYEMVDTVNGMAQGLEPASGDTPDHVLSNRYAFMHTYTIKNVSGVNITDLNFFQFLHGLETDTSVYDNRNYDEGTPWEDYQYDITQTGQSFSLNQVTGQVVLHSDIISFHSMVAPVDWENGLYGQPSTDDHFDGKPSVGVHYSVEADDLDETMDEFTASEGRWVSGAQKFALGSLAPDASVAITMMLTIQSNPQVHSDGIQVRFTDMQLDGTTLKIYFDEVANPDVNFFYSIYETSDLSNPVWQQLFISLIGEFIDSKIVYHYEITVDPMDTETFYRIEARPVATPPTPIIVN